MWSTMGLERVYCSFLQIKTRIVIWIFKCQVFYKVTGTIQSDRKFCIFLKLFKILYAKSFWELASVWDWAKMWFLSLRNHVSLIKCPGVPSSRIPWAITSKIQSGNWATREAAGATLFNCPLMCTTWLSISPARQLWIWVKIRWSQKIVLGCGKTLKLYIYLILLLWLPVRNVNYSKAWLKVH